jgi:hypothetical protein
MLSAARVSAIEESEWFRRRWSPYLLLDTDLRIRAVNSAYVRATELPREGLIGAPLFDAFPDNPDDPTGDGVTSLSGSLAQVCSSATQHWMGLIRYDVPDVSNPGGFVYREWVSVNSPIKVDGKLAGILHHTQNVTRVMSAHPHMAKPGPGPLRSAAAVMSRQFPALSAAEVLSVLAHSHCVVMETTGAPDSRQAEALAIARLEVRAGRLAER